MRSPLRPSLVFKYSIPASRARHLIRLRPRFAFRTILNFREFSAAGPAHPTPSSAPRFAQVHARAATGVGSHPSAVEKLGRDQCMSGADRARGLRRCHPRSTATSLIRSNCKRDRSSADRSCPRCRDANSASEPVWALCFGAFVALRYRARRRWDQLNGDALTRAESFRDASSLERR